MVAGRAGRDRRSWQARSVLVDVALDDVELAGRVVTADALHTQVAHATYLVAMRHAGYLLTVKDNQPGLAAAIDRLPLRRFPRRTKRLSGATAASSSVASKPPRRPPRRGSPMRRRCWC